MSNEKPRMSARRRIAMLTTLIAAAATFIGATLAAHRVSHPSQAGHSARSQAGHSAPHRARGGLTVTPGSYIGLYARGTPQSYAGVKSFARATGVQPNVVVYYSGWPQPFETKFATAVAKAGAVPLVQMDPDNIKMAAIAAGKYDDYLKAFAASVRIYRHPVIVSFGHEMNGYWYSWGYTHTSPTDFVAAWRHIVTVFRASGARNVTWLWTINTIHTKTKVPAPGPWWPGDSYVTWVGIDGYYINSSAVFASVFGPTIVYVRTLTHKPIIIPETSARPVTSQPAKLADLFAGIHLYRLLGFIWFNSVYKVDWRLSNPTAIAAFHRYAENYHMAAR
jgi:mannan endo-1,4-beta-mannosidase